MADISPDAPVQYRYIEYERPYLYPKQEAIFFGDHRYAYCEASTKSGKTHACIVWICEQAIMHGGPGKNFWWVAPVRSQAEIAYRRIIHASPKGMLRTHDSELYIEFPNGARIWFKSAEKPDNLYGEDVYGAVLDEASRCRYDAWMALRSTLTATRGPCRLIANVIGKNNWFYIECRAVERGRPNAKFARITALDAVKAKILDADEIEDARRILPENRFQELYMAIAMDDDQAFIGSDVVEAAMKNTTAREFGAKIIGADPSQGKADPAAFAIRRGPVISRVEEHEGMDEIGFKTHLRRLIEVEKPQKVFVDGTGFGLTIVKQMWEETAAYRELIVPINFGAQKTLYYPDEYANKRAEMWGEMGKWLNDDNDPPSIPDDVGLGIELTCLNYTTDRNGRFLLESKDDLEKRGYKSPNKGDACALTFAEPVSNIQASAQTLNYSQQRRNRVLI